MDNIWRVNPLNNVEQHLAKLNEGSPTSYQTSLSRSNNERRKSSTQSPHASYSRLTLCWCLRSRSWTNWIVVAPEVTVADAPAAAADDRCISSTGSSTDLLYRYSRSSNASDMNDAVITSFGARNYCKIEIAPAGIIYYHVPRYPFNMSTWLW